jgi:hypothetical protein
MRVSMGSKHPPTQHACGMESSLASSEFKNRPETARNVQHILGHPKLQKLKPQPCDKLTVGKTAADLNRNVQHILGHPKLQKLKPQPCRICPV